MAPQAGILYVTMAPQPSLTPAQFHDWYQNEHGPGRLRLPYIFPNGFRYRGADGAEPEWMAVYDVTDMQYLTQDVYTSLRLDPKQSERERDTMKQIKVNRKFYDLVYEKKAEGFKEMEKVEEEREGNVVVAASITLKDQGKRADYDRWMEEEHIELLAKVPGFRRARRFVTSSVEPAKDPNDTEYLALYDYAPDNGLGGPEFKAAISTTWRNEIFETAVKEKQRRMFNICYTFGPAPRDLKSLSDPSASPFHSAFHRTTTFPASGEEDWPAIESYITTPDGCPLPYRLEGSTDLHAPLIILDNAVLTTLTIWDSFVKSFLSKPENKKYRILRFNKRGRYASVGTEEPVTIDLLAKDIITLLDAFRVPKAAAVIGVSLGGATAMNVALKYPKRVQKFIACDTNPSTPASNPSAWDERVGIASKEGMVAQETGEPIVGSSLAEVTVRRWFVPASYEDPVLAEEAKRVTEMVRTNSLEGFRKGVKALYEYDMREAMKSATVPGAFVVGSGDGVLPKGMRKMCEDYAGESEFYEIEGAGHLPMVEKPMGFAEVVGKVLKS